MKPTLLTRIREWLSRDDHVRRLWLGRNCVLVAWAGLLIAALCPPGGLGVPVCWFHASTGLPCPGCGITRSLSCALRGLFQQSWNYHPMGWIILLLFLATAIESLLPGKIQDRFVARMKSRALLCNSLYLCFVSVFVLFGVLRCLGVALQHLGWLS